MVKSFFALLLFIASINMQAQGYDPGEDFNKAVKYYSDKRYSEALTIFSKLAAEKNTVYSFPSGLFRGKIFLLENNLSQAETIFDTLSAKDSTGRREISLNKALLHFKKGNYYETAVQLLDLLRISGKSEYYVYARECLDTVVTFNLSPVEVKVLIDLSGRELKPLLTLLLGKTYQAQDNWTEAKTAYLKVIQQYPSSPEKKEAEDYFYQRKSVGKTGPAEPVIVVLLPENSTGAVLQIREGIKYAVHEFNSSRENRTGLVSLDMQKSNIKEIKAAVLSMNTRCVLGPVFSDDVRIVLSEFKGIKIPIISPTATDNDLTTLNEFFFQANPDFTHRAKAMAQYIFYVENKRKLAVLNAIDGYSPLLAATFTQEFRKLGGEVVINQTYKSGTPQLDDQISKINEVIADIEGIYIPVSDKEDIPPVLSTLSKYNIILPLYGNQDWFLGKGYESYPFLDNNLTFESDYFINYNSDDYIEFDKKFEAVTNLSAERNVLYGYDITRYFLNQLSKINADPDVIASRMMNGNIVNGFHNNISFTGDRVNRFVNIVRYRNGVFELADKFKTGN